MKLTAGKVEMFIPTNSKNFISMHKVPVRKYHCELRKRQIRFFYFLKFHCFHFVSATQHTSIQVEKCSLGFSFERNVSFHFSRKPRRPWHKLKPMKTLFCKSKTSWQKFQPAFSISCHKFCLKKTKFLHALVFLFRL